MSAIDSHRRRPRPVAWLVRGLAAVVLSMAAVPAAASAQVTNPPLRAECGLKVALVLDESASIASPGGGLGDQTAAVRSAANAFVTALESTGSPVAVTAFSISARDGVVPYTEVNEGTIATFRNWINNTNVNNTGFNPGAPNRSGTNWEDGLLHADEVAGGPPDLMVFVTDGNPNRVGRAQNTSSATTAAAVAAAVTAADTVKRRGTRIFAVGVGTAVGTPAHAENIRKISGTTEFTGGNFASADYTLVQRFEDLRTELTGIVAALCGSSFIITKFVSEPEVDAFTPAPGWEFRTTLDPSPGHTWLEPASAGTDRSATAIGNSDGRAIFHWRLQSADTARLGVTHETVKPGFHFVLATCQTHHADGTLTASDSTTEIPGATLAREEFRTCEVYNAGPGAHLTVVKQLMPSSDPGRFDLLVGDIARIEQVGDGGSTGRLLMGLGTHTVGERVTAAQAGVITLDQYEISTRCVDRSTGSTVASGTGGTPVPVPLERETDDVVCTIANRRIAGPPPAVTPPAPPVIPPLCAEPEACAGVAGATAAGAPARLLISKRMPTRAQVGHRVPLTITVRSVGRATAQRVRLHETPTAGGRIVRVADARATRRRDGTVRWSLGDLAPGATRTVHATMLVTRSGALRNSAVADADNAGVVFDRAIVRVTAPPAPAFTG